MTDELDKLVDLLLALLDRIELEEDWTLASQRFQIAEDSGFEVVISHETSGRIQ